MITINILLIMRVLKEAQFLRSFISNCNFVIFKPKFSNKRQTRVTLKMYQFI